MTVWKRVSSVLEFPSPAIIHCTGGSGDIRIIDENDDERIYNFSEDVEIGVVSGVKMVFREGTTYTGEISY